MRRPSLIFAALFLALLYYFSVLKTVLLVSAVALLLSFLLRKYLFERVFQVREP